MRLLVFREIDENDAGPACLTDMRDGVGDPGWRVPFGNLEQGSGLVREPLRERNIGFTLLRCVGGRLLGDVADLLARDRGDAKA
jgi:hypothetical protein